MLLSLVLLPIIAASFAFFIKKDALRRTLLVATASAHSVLTIRVWCMEYSSALNGWLTIDAPGLLFLTITSFLFLAASVYAIGYLSREEAGARKDFDEGFFFSNTPEAIFTTCLLLFLSTMTLVTLSHNFGLLWVAMEATTLVSAPLIYFHRHHRSLEATWKYLVICSVGIALALLGNFFLVVSASKTGTESSLVLEHLLGQAKNFNVPWLRAAFIFFLVGYGTKMGLAPMHTWLPDAHSESPSVVSALLSGALLNCAFLGILRSHQIMIAAGQKSFSCDLLILFGLISITWAAIFIFGQADYKRMLAYSSVEHIGILALGVGLGGLGTFAAMLHAVNHSLTKASLFLLAGNILAHFGTKTSRNIKGIIGAMPVTGVLWFAGFFAICGVPPFGTFISELTIVKAGLDQGRFWIVAAFLALLGLVFIGMSKPILKMSFGENKNEKSTERLAAVISPLILLILTLILGLYIPPGFNRFLNEVAQTLGGN